MTFVSRANVICAVVIGIVVLVNTHAAVRLTALLGAICLGLLLIVPHLPRSWTATPMILADSAKLILASRKQLGLWAAAWFTAHAGLAVYLYFDGPLQLFLQARRSPVVALEVASLAILLLLAATSNRWSQRNMVVWKRIQALVWAVPAMALVSSTLAALDFVGQLPLLLIAPGLFMGAVLAGLSALFSRTGRRDWTRAACLAAGVVAAIVAVIADNV